MDHSGERIRAQLHGEAAQNEGKITLNTRELPADADEGRGWKPNGRRSRSEAGAPVAIGQRGQKLHQIRGAVGERSE
jgi:hypothetical protein